MNTTELLDIIARGEDSGHQFKADFTSVDAMAAELVAFANGKGGLLLIGVGDDGEIIGLDKRSIARLNQLLSNAAAQADEQPVERATIDELNREAFQRYYERRYGEAPEASGLSLAQLLINLNLARDYRMNLAGLLLFGRAPQRFRPALHGQGGGFPRR